MSGPQQGADHVPAVPGGWGVDADPEGPDDSRGENVEGDPALIAEPPPAGDNPAGEPR